MLSADLQEASTVAGDGEPGHRDGAAAQALSAFRPVNCCCSRGPVSMCNVLLFVCAHKLDTLVPSVCSYRLADDITYKRKT